MFFIGMYTAKNEKKIIDYVKSQYAKVLALSAVGTFIMTLIAIVATGVLTYYRPGALGKVLSVVCLLFQTSATTLFVAFVLIATMKIKLSNIILDFLGKIALEVYLVHRFFLVFLDSDYVSIENTALYVGAVFAATIVASIILHKVDGVIVNAIKGIVSTNKSQAYSA